MRTLLLALMAIGMLSFYVPDSDGLYAEVKTSKGDFVIELYFEQTPMTVGNFVGLVEGTIANKWKPEGENFYDGLYFHRVEPGKVVQTGCPKGDGYSEPGYQFKTEIVKSLKHDKPGVVAMANSGKKRNGSQWYITLDAYPHLDGDFTIFGQVVDGLEVVKTLTTVDQIKTIRIVRIGEAAKAFDAATTFYSLAK